MARVRLDAVSASAVDLARDAAVEVGGSAAVGEHLRARAEGDRLVTHTFACRAKGYPGWEWTVTLARAPRVRTPTICEVELIATSASVTAPGWLPWSERVTPGDLGPGDVLPPPDLDDRLEAGHTATGEQDVDQMAFWELGLGRRHVLSREGRMDACARWQQGDFGPGSTMARQAAQKCRECGFLLPLAGAVRQNFGVCTNAWSPADGRVISLDYGCGAHSEQQAPPLPDVKPPLIDDLQIDLLAVPRGAAADAPAAEEPGAGQTRATTTGSAPEVPEPAASDGSADRPAVDRPAVDHPAGPGEQPAAQAPGPDELSLLDQAPLQAQLEFDDEVRPTD